MTKRDKIERGPDHTLLRLDVHLDGTSVEAGEMWLTRLSRFAHAPDDKVTDGQLTDLACRIYESRRVRARFLSASLLGEPVWDMLLALYCFSARGEALSVTGLCFAAGVPPTTALRWAQIMEQKKLITRSRDSKDARRAFVALSEEGATLMRSYLATIYQTMSEGS